jgi:putative membrane protein
MDTLTKTTFNPEEITRPDPVLLKYYLLVSLLTGPLFPIALLPLFFKYETLRYHFDSDGISMSWGILFRREIHLTYRRIQDIHLTRNIVQRWLGLATVAVQTASGSATPEMSIEGVLQAEALRDHLYSKMRGAEDDGGQSANVTGGDASEDSGKMALDLLKDIRDALKSGPR